MQGGITWGVSKVHDAQATLDFLNQNLLSVDPRHQCFLSLPALILLPSQGKPVEKRDTIVSATYIMHITRVSAAVLKTSHKLFYLIPQKKPIQ